MKFSEPQVKWLEDRLINKIAPIHMTLQTIFYGKTITKRDVNVMLNRLEAMVKDIRYLRPKHKRFKI